MPEDLFAEIKDFAKRKEWSLAETFRRGAELLLDTYSDDAAPASQAWQPPTSGAVGWKGLTDSQLRDLAFDDQSSSPIEL